MGTPHDINRCLRELNAVDFQLDDDARMNVTRQDVAQQRHACERQLIRRARGNRPAKRRRAIQRSIVVDNDAAVGRQVNIELEAISAEREAAVECGHRVFRRQFASAAMCENQRTTRRRSQKERMPHDAPVYLV